MCSDRSLVAITRLAAQLPMRDALCLTNLSLSLSLSLSVSLHYLAPLPLSSLRTSEPECLYGLQFVEVCEFARSVALAELGKVLFLDTDEVDELAQRHTHLYPMAVVLYLQHLESGILHRDLNGGGASVETILYEFLQCVGRRLNDFAGSNAVVDTMNGEVSDG